MGKTLWIMLGICIAAKITALIDVEMEEWLAESCDFGEMGIGKKMYWGAWDLPQVKWLGMEF